MKGQKIVYNRLNYYRYPESEHREARCYYHNPLTGRRLHVVIWEDHNNCSVPKGYHIHHKNGNYDDNTIENLTCVPIGEHIRITLKNLTPEQKEKNIQHLAAIRPLTKKWHGSKEGHDWHKNHALQRKPLAIKKNCEVCGKEFIDKSGHGRFCHQNCKATALRRRRGIKPK